MIVCHCTGKTDRHVNEAVESGARSSDEVTRQCRAGGVCGGCVPTIECLLRRALAAAAPAPSLAEAASS